MGERETLVVGEDDLLFVFGGFGGFVRFEAGPEIEGLQVLGEDGGGRLLGAGGHAQLGVHLLAGRRITRPVQVVEVGAEAARHGRTVAEDWRAGRDHHLVVGGHLLSQTPVQGCWRKPCNTFGHVGSTRGQHFVSWRARAHSLYTTYKLGNAQGWGRFNLAFLCTK